MTWKLLNSIKPLAFIYNCDTFNPLD